MGGRAGLGLAIIALLVVSGCAGSEAGRALSQHYRNPAGWSFKYPAGMTIERSSLSSRFYIHEVTVATFPPRRAVRSGSTPNGGWIAVDPPRPKDGPFPLDGVAFRVYQQEGGPFAGPLLPETHFPLRLSEFEPDRFDYAKRHPRPLVKGISAAGRGYTVYAWAGPQASSKERAAIEAIVASLRFPHLKPGTVVGDFLSVLRPAGSYPVGSFTRVRAQGQPFYLVHAPGGFYPIGWKRNTISGGYKSRCMMRFDRAHKEFFCTNMRLRWDRIGRPLVYPAFAAPDPLNVATAGSSWDGHVLLAPGIAAFGSRRMAAQFWSHWSPRTSSGK